MQVSQEFRFRIVEATSLTELLGQAQTGLVQRGLPLERGPIVLDQECGLDVGPRRDLVAPEVGLGILRRQDSPAFDRPDGPVEPVGGQEDPRQFLGNHLPGLELLEESSRQDRLGFVEAVGAGMIDGGQATEPFRVEAELPGLVDGLLNLTRLVEGQRFPCLVIIGFGRPGSHREPAPQGLTGRLVPLRGEGLSDRLRPGCARGTGRMQGRSRPPRPRAAPPPPSRESRARAAALASDHHPAAGTVRDCSTPGLSPPTLAVRCFAPMGIAHDDPASRTLSTFFSIMADLPGTDKSTRQPGGANGRPIKAAVGGA